ncbi:SDR family oxidoreductase [Pigmentiphaga sp. CHJ604]|uniref:SDR family oxidoreductase n=1 Tax=Pigmentiphaga sp. CHJ604 TaxID=3081984 RepID=UPI0030D1AEED
MKPQQMSIALTGASGGIGAALARRLTSAGARMLLIGRSKDALLALASELSAGAQNRRRVDALIVDVTSESGRQAIRDAAQARDVNVLINNAGLAGFGPAGALDDHETEAVLRTNLLAPILLTANLLPHLRQQPCAQILNIGSTLGSIGVPGFSVYGASKAGLRSYSEALRRELADSPVRVQYLAPRSVRTPFNDERVQAFNAATGSRADSPEWVAQVALRLLQTGRAQCFMGTMEPIAARLNGALSVLLDGAFRKHRRALQQSVLPHGDHR